MPQRIFTKKMMIFIAVVIICLLLVFLNPSNLFDPVRLTLLRVAYPFQKIFFMAGHSVSETFRLLGSIGELKSENERLIKENNALAAQLAQLQDERKENESLRDQLNVAPRQKYDLEASFVIGQDPQRLGSWIMLDKGGAQGIRTGMPVVAYEGILIGRIEEITASTAKVALLSDSSSAVNVADLETSAKGILRGEYGLGLTMDMVMQSDVLNNGDTITTSGLGGDFPSGLLIGKIQETHLSNDKLFQQAVISPRIKYSDLDMVFVIKNEK